MKHNGKSGELAVYPGKDIESQIRICSVRIGVTLYHTVTCAYCHSQAVNAGGLNEFYCFIRVCIVQMIGTEMLISQRAQLCLNGNIILVRILNDTSGQFNVSFKGQGASVYHYR